MMNGGIQVRVSDLLYAFFKRRTLIAALTVAGLMVGLVLSLVSYLRGDISRDYRITGSFAINTRVSDGRYSSGSSYPMSSDVQLAEDLSKAVIYVVNSSKTLNSVISGLRLTDVAADDISSNLTLSQYENTHIVEAVLYWRSAEEGIAILNSINTVANTVLRETLNVGGVSVIEAPSAHYMVGGSLNAALCGALALLGLAAGLGIAVLELIVRPTLLNPRDLETNFNLEVLGEIPKADAYFRAKGTALQRVQSDPGIADSFASLAHIVHNRLGSRSGPHILYCTSATRGEGRTTAVANLGIQLAANEKRVLMIDFDLLNPHLGNLFLENVDYDHSLNALYRGEINELEAITTVGGNLDLLPAVLERSTIQLDSTLFSLVKNIAAGYDYILMDAAPVGMSASSLSLNEIATAALLLVRFDSASVQEIHDTLDRMDKSGVRMLGSVVNDVKFGENAVSYPRPARSSRRRKASAEPFIRSSEAAADQKQTAAVLPMQAEESGEVISPNKLASDATAEDFTSMLFRMYGQPGAEDRAAEDGLKANMPSEDLLPEEDAPGVPTQK